jgi:hypothetical protein
MLAEVIEFYGTDWTYHDVSLEKVGWDITFTLQKTGEVARAEVEGVSGAMPIVLLTANEIRAAEDQVDWHLCVVTSALSTPRVTKYAADEVLAVVKPYVYKATMPQQPEPPSASSAERKEPSGEAARCMVACQPGRRVRDPARCGERRGPASCQRPGGPWRG